MLRLALIALLLAGCRSPQSASAPVASAGPGNTSTPIAAPNEIQVIPLKNADAREVAGLLFEFLHNAPVRDGSAPPRIIADPRTNSLVVRAGAQDMTMIRDLVAKLDVRIEKPAP